MRVNIYAEETTNRIEIIEKKTADGVFTGLRFYLELPATIPDNYPPGMAGRTVQGPFIHRPGDDDSAAVTFWGKRDMRDNFRKALELLDAHYEEVSLRHPPVEACYVTHDDYVGECPGCHMPLPSVEERVKQWVANGGNAGPDVV